MSNCNVFFYVCLILGAYECAEGSAVDLKVFVGLIAEGRIKVNSDEETFYVVDSQFMDSKLGILSYQ